MVPIRFKFKSAFVDPRFLESRGSMLRRWLGHICMTPSCEQLSGVSVSFEGLSFEIFIVGSVGFTTTLSPWLELEEVIIVSSLSWDSWELGRRFFTLMSPRTSAAQSLMSLLGAMLDAMLGVMERKVVSLGGIGKLRLWVSGSRQGSRWEL